MLAALDPTLGAILPLVGVALGAVGGGLAQYLLRRRDERREWRAIARLLVNDLMSTALYLEETARDRPGRMMKGEARYDAGFGLRASLWQEHELNIARHVTDSRAWATIVDAQKRGVVASHAIDGAKDLALGIREARGVATALRAAARELWWFAYPDSSASEMPAATGPG